MLISSYKFACIGTLALLMASSQVHSADVIKVGDTSIRFGVLVDLAPVIDKVKAYDTEIVMNSMRFKWQGIRVELRERLQLDDILYLETSRFEAGEAAPPSERAFGAGP